MTSRQEGRRADKKKMQGEITVTRKGGIKQTGLKTSFIEKVLNNPQLPIFQEAFMIAATHSPHFGADEGDPVP